MKFWLFLIGLIMILITSYAFYDFYKKNYKSGEIINYNLNENEEETNSTGLNMSNITNNSFKQKGNENIPITFTEFSNDFKDYINKKYDYFRDIKKPLIILKKGEFKNFHKNFDKNFISMMIDYGNENHQENYIQTMNFHIFSMKNTILDKFLEDYIIK
ncbi:hypothetical protein A0H76_1689 [Hepatospora eriocheir]|uniref:Uncharacterized protein n=1 Tax=Hepatospora eriocheir TaxID=1081669 RepID=A0A1X0QKK3_9MICR|nr:hypothetical protein A0H76_1689 [Hepatospora eriocheir]